MESAASSIRPLARKLAEDFIGFINKAVTPFHVVGN
jgi:aspartyl aminopeptidase